MQRAAARVVGWGVDKHWRDALGAGVDDALREAAALLRLGDDDVEGVKEVAEEAGLKLEANPKEPVQKSVHPVLRKGGRRLWESICLDYSIHFWSSKFKIVDYITITA